ncbi:C13 family peptidase [Rhodanobacter lindaniclasticus]|uniref:C13 family peptidase n=1 Tax=Rhodanobacter lindaniclasticus TaxID=75310 RepID=UPI00109F936F|nr:C13 family peptidase [Rhodanobacter lindaniclasticus]
MRRGLRTLLTIAAALSAGVALAAWLPVDRLPDAADTPSATLPQVETPVEPAAVSDAWPASAPSPEQVLYAQPQMLRDALARLTPRVAGKPNLYLLTFAGDGGEDVFRNEAEYAARLFGSRFGPSVHSLVLENNPATLTTRPLASWSNLEAALDGIQQVMRPDQDILVLYITSHGGEDHTLLVDMDPLPLDQIGAQDLADILAARHFKWKVVVVNACYSGGFVPPLRGPGTMVLTAARSDRSSFGCGSDSDVTYFGKAWLVDALNHTDNFVDAFKQARSDIATWEKQDELTPSEPQIDIGSGIAAQLAAWRNHVVPGPAVSFKPAVSDAARAPTTP